MLALLLSVDVAFPLMLNVVDCHVIVKFEKIKIVNALDIQS